MEFWLRKDKHTAIGEYELSVNPNISLDHILNTPQKFHHLISLLDNFYKKKYGSEYFSYSKEYKEYTPPLESLYYDFINSNNVVETNDESQYKNYSNRNYFLKLAEITGKYFNTQYLTDCIEQFNSYGFILPEIKISYSKFETSLSSQFQKVFFDRNSINIPHLLIGLKDILSLLDYASKLGFYIKDFSNEVFERIFWINDKGSPRDGWIYLDFPEHFIYSSNSPELFWQSIYGLFSQIKQSWHEKKTTRLSFDEDKYCFKNEKELTSILNGIHRKLADQIHKSIQNYKSYEDLLDEFYLINKKKIDVSAFIDWPNVNQSVLGLDINWGELFNYISEEIYKIEKANVHFNHAYLYHYDPQGNFKDKFQEEAFLNNQIRIDSLISENAIYNLEERKVSGKSQSENQAVDKEILNHIHSIAASESTRRYFIIISSDKDIYLGFEDLKGIKELDERFKIIVCSFNETVSMYQNLSNQGQLIFKSLNDLIKFVK